MFRFAPDDDERLDLFDEDEPLLDLLPAERPPLDDLRDELPPDDKDVFDRPPDEALFDLPLDDELLPLLLFEAPELLDELDLPPPGLFVELDLPPLDDFEEPLAFRPDEDEEDDLARPVVLDDLPPELDFDRLLPALDREDELFPLVDLPPLREPDARPPLVDVMFSAAAPIAPIAAPAAAPLIISPATSMTLSTMPDVELLDLDDLPRDEVDEDELLLREPP